MGMSDRPSSIEVRIDELVLRGFSAGDRFHLAEALQNELTRLFAESTRGKTVSRTISLDRLSADAIRVAPGAKPAAIGVQLGQSVYRQIAPAVFGSRQPKAGRRRPG